VFGLGNFGPLHWFVFAAIIAVFFGVPYLLVRIVRRAWLGKQKTSPSDQELADRWKENADIFIGEP
jgi:hypothetical protein